jgi:ssDNA-binding Zn-finger/Zn-ribbon topoisomerase 1
MFGDSKHGETVRFTDVRGLLMRKAQKATPAMDEPVICPYCGSHALLRHSREVYGRTYGFMWVCTNFPECDAYVGAHKNSNKPLGTLANKELRDLRVRAHNVFDRVWRQGGLTRSQAYKLLREKMGMTEDEAHIAKMNAEQCKRVLAEFRGYIGNSALQ